VQIAATCCQDPTRSLIALALVVGERMVGAALLATADLRPPVLIDTPEWREAEFRATDRLMRERSAGELGSAV
jgi:hypothetical protein